jgi:lysophospholipase L1-like esterase
MTDVELCVSNGDTKCPVWCIGDSYFGISVERVLGQLRALGFWGGILFDGIAGLNSEYAYPELLKLLAFGRPKTLVWYIGMNDSNADYLQYMTQVKEYCDENNITLILNKVPTVPTVDNETKDGYVVASGCRYINSYLAVGANSSGEWYAGFLSSDNVHPTSTGAKALAMRMLIDVPELAEYGYTAAIT